MILRIAQHALLLRTLICCLILTVSSIELLTYADVIRYAVRRARLQQGLEQAQVAARMAGLGYSWHPQTVSSVENGRRRINAEELLGLSLALETTVSYLLRPYGGHREAPAVTLPSGGVLLPGVVAASVGTGRRDDDWAFRWDGDDPVWPPIEALEELVRIERVRQRISREVDDAVAAAHAEGGSGGPVDFAPTTARLSALQDELDHILQALREGRAWRETRTDPPGEEDDA